MKHLQQVLFLDIETVPAIQDFNGLSPIMQKEWIRKVKNIKLDADAIADPAQLFSERAGVFSEFAKVVCICFGSFHLQEDGWKLRLKSLANSEENILLKDFCEVITKFTKIHPDLKFSGHNIKEFDIPFLCRRMIINGIGLPDCMQLSGKKPWEVGHLDTLEMWRFGDHKNYTTLSLLAEILGIPSPKSDIDGSMVANVFYKENDLPRIAKYCLQDVITSAKVYLKLKGVNDFTFEPVYTNEQA